VVLYLLLLNHMRAIERILSSLRPVGLLLLACGLASSSTIVATGVDWSRGESIWINADGKDTPAYFAGVIDITVNDTEGSFNRDTLCVDLFTDIYLGQQYDTTVVGPGDVAGKSLPRVSWLVDNALLPTQNSGYTSALPSADWVSTVDQGAGIQLAIWDIVHDGGDGFSLGRVQAGSAANPTSAGVLAWAQTYEGLSFGQSSNLAYIYQNVDLGTGQPAQMLAGPLFQDGGPIPGNQDPLADAPEPGTLLLAGSALIAAGCLFRRKLAR